jgi:hypothetical protein
MYGIFFILSGFFLIQYFDRMFVGEKNIPILLWDFHFLHANIFQSTMLCEFKCRLRNTVKKKFLPNAIWCFSQYLSEGYLQVWALSCPTKVIHFDVMYLREIYAFIFAFYFKSTSDIHVHCSGTRALHTSQLLIFHETWR